MARHFLDDLPLEIRNEIYPHLLSTEYTKRPVRDDERPSRGKRGLGCKHLYDFQPAILLTNKQINKEARHFLYDENLFVLIRAPQSVEFESIWLEELTPLATKEDKVCCFRSALRISLQVDIGVQVKRDLRLESQVVIAANELPVLCSILKKIDNEGPGILSDLKLVLAIFPSYQLDVDAFAHTGPSSRGSWNPRSLSQQRRLLEPFAMLHSMTNLEIADVNGDTQNIDAQLMVDVKKRASRSLSTEEVLDGSAKIKEQGNKAFHAGNFELAYSLYMSALGNIEAGERYLDERYFDTSTREGALAEQKYFQAHFLMASRIWSNSIAALLRLQRWTAAHKKATIGIEKIKSVRGEITFDPGEVAKIYFRRALSSEGMGKNSRAIEEVREALSLDPNNAKMKAKLQEWKLQARNPKQVEAVLRALTV
ncbi:MAG: hypothetical protein ASARMPREDX12_008077 [Alectoria sarmentosa]|nr:MAG: hypothetical protein ASARMPREDX12_008077 [Alectoria sarmentosa]